MDETKDFQVSLAKSPRGKSQSMWYAEGPGQPGYYGATLCPHLYVESPKEVQRWLPMLQSAYDAGQNTKLKEIQDALGITR